MSREILELISPSYVGEDRLAASVDPVTPPVALQPLTVNFDYSQAAPVGVVLPIEVIVQPPSRDGSGYIRRVFRRVVPISFTFIPIASGTHLVVVREVGHNRWFGRLLVEVEGDKLSEVTAASR